jgi:hypothetical protein
MIAARQPERKKDRTYHIQVKQHINAFPYPLPVSLFVAPTDCCQYFSTVIKLHEGEGPEHMLRCKTSWKKILFAGPVPQKSCNLATASEEGSKSPVAPSRPMDNSLFC